MAQASRSDAQYSDVQYTPRMKLHLGTAGLIALIAAGANFDSVSTDGWNPLAVAIRTENTDNAKLLVDAGADLALAKSLVTEKARTVPSEEARTEILAALDSFEKLVENPPDD